MNPADQRFEDRVYKRLTAVEKSLQDIKTAQPTGLDGITFDFSDGFEGHVYLQNYEYKTWRVNFNAAVPKLYASELAVSFFINNDLNMDYHWPDGPAIAEPPPPSQVIVGLIPLDIAVWYDLYASDETGSGRKSYYIRIVNTGAFAKTVHMRGALVFPKGNVN